MSASESYIDNTLIPAMKEFIEEYIRENYTVGELRHVAVRGHLEKFWQDWVAERYKGENAIGFDDMSHLKEALKAIIEPMLFVWRGEWQSGEKYIENDWVTHGGSSYICTAVVDPSSIPPEDDEDNWGLLAESGNSLAQEAANSAAASAAGAATAANSAAASAAGAATAAGSAIGAISSANAATATANAAAANANQKAQDAQNTIDRMEEMADSITAGVKLTPQEMALDYPRVVTLRNSEPLRISYTLLPAYTGKNVLFLGDDNAVSVMPDGSLKVNRVGKSKINVIPTENTSLYKTITIEVIEAGMRKVNSGSLRLTGSGNIRFT
jgi:hypothetical protein